MRLSDLCVALWTVWIPSTLDFLMPGSCPPGSGMPGFILITVVFAYATSLYGSSKLIEVIIQAFTRCPSAVLIPFLFVLILVLMMSVQNAVFVLQFVKCGPTCIVF